MAQARLSAYLDAIGHGRWFLLATTLLSSLILFHEYLDYCGQQEDLLRRTAAKRIVMKTESHHKAQADIFAAVVSELELAHPGKYKNEHTRFREIVEDGDQSLAFRRAFADEPNARFADKLGQYSEQQYKFDKGTNTLKDRKMIERELPFLGMKIPGNDYVPIMAFMLGIFTIGLWLNCRSIHACVKAMAPSTGANVTESVELLQVARLYFTFTGAGETDGRQVAAKCVEYAALAMPAVALFVAGVVELLEPLSIIRTEPYGIGRDWAYMIFRLIIVWLSWVATFAATFGAYSVSASIDTVVNKRH